MSSSADAIGSNGATRIKVYNARDTSVDAPRNIQGAAIERGRATDGQCAGTRRAGAANRLASTPDGREAGDAHSMASKGIPLVLAVEIDAAWPTPIAGQRSVLDRGHGRGKSHVGRGTDCVGTAGKARGSGLAAYRAAVHGFGSRSQEQARLTGMERLLAQSRAIGARMRLLPTARQSECCGTRCSGQSRDPKRCNSSRPSWR